MNNIFIPDSTGGCSRKSLIIIFLGWGFPPEAFSGIRKLRFDLLLLSGYRGMTGQQIEKEITAIVPRIASGDNTGYDEIVVIGWSFGVKAASMFLKQTDIPVTMRLAVNGTEYHTDDKRGIPTSVFKGTLSGLSATTLEKFHLRCAGCRERLAKLLGGIQELKSVDTAPLREELEWFGSLPPVPVSNLAIWDKVVIGEGDRIFPPANQLAAWEGHDIFTIKEMPHLPDFQWIIDNFIVDKNKVCDRFSIAGATYTSNATVQHDTARKLYDKFQAIFASSRLKAGPTYRQNQMSLLELGYGAGALTRLYVPQIVAHCRSVVLSDIQAPCPSDIPARWIYDVGGENCDCHVNVEDAESATFKKKYLRDDSLDLIFSSSMFQWLNSPGMMLRRCCDALRADGMIILSFYGPGTFKEIHQTVGTGLKYPSAEWMARIARECDMEINLLEIEKDIMRFDTPADALRHLKLTGVNGVPGAPSPTRARQLLAHWPSDCDGKAPLTFHPVYMILTKKQSQPQTNPR